MAESAISYVIQKLIDLLLQESQFLLGVRGQLEGLKDELKRMRCFMKDADAKQEDDERVRNWVSDIRNVAYDAEDLIDTFVLRVKHQKRRRCFVKRYTSIFKDWFDIYNVGKEIESIQARINAISRSCETYGIRNIGEGTSPTISEKLRVLRRSSPRGLAKDVVGLKEDTAKLVAQLFKQEARRSVISIIGMGGIGKTTLAKKVYNHRDVRVHFDCRAWVCVSQDCRWRDLLQGVIKEVIKPSKEVEKLQEEELEEMLYDHLQTRRYLVVLDDIWRMEDWDCLERAFPDSNKGSRLMLTTRNREVALYADARSIPHELRLLSKEDSWELFCRKAFVDCVDTSCPPELNDIGRKIVMKCADLPLAIIIIGGLLSRKKKLPSEWERVLDNMSSHLAKGQTGVSAILALSYHDLPFYLKSCFLYLGNFPEDHVIPTCKLLRLWIAEGFIPPRGKRMESTAEDCLNELIDRNMVQMVRTSVNERVMECRLHDLLRELSISKAKEEIFLEIYRDTDCLPSAKTRHQAIHSTNSMYFESRPSTPLLRSLLVFNARISIIHICKSFQLLRVLDIENIKACYLPREIGKLINLRYLGLGNTGISELHPSMIHLQSLQTLDIREASFIKIPKVITKMENLRHLHMSPLKCSGQFKIDTLRHLQTLSKINVHNWRGNDSKELSNLRKLRVVSLASEDLREFFGSIAKLEHLVSLHLEPVGLRLPPSLTGLSNLHRLTKLHIQGDESELPGSHEFPPNLSQLTLIGFVLHQCTMEDLGKLQKLFILRLRGCYIRSKELTFSINGVPQLKFLLLDSMPSLEELIVQEGAMLRLRQFQISTCANLSSLPEGTQFLSGLQELVIDKMPQSFEDKLRQADSYKVQHVPSIIFTNTRKRNVRI